MDGGVIESGARIGPNAILQLIPVVDAAIGPARRADLFAQAGVALPPPDAGMLPEAQVIRLHRTLALRLPDQSAQLSRAAGLATGDYILANRIPAPARVLIRALPAPLGARLLVTAIAKHAWTFAGSGRFRILSHRPLTVSITANPLAVGIGSAPSCHWHSAVFQRLFSALVWPAATVTETSCCACGEAACTFTIAPTPSLRDSNV
jgi:divinyl protochlorophyllide a 8-vinyl-reductase